MQASDSMITAAVAAHQAGRHDEALVLSQQLFAAAEAQRVPGNSPCFAALFVLGQLLPVYPPARAAVQALRDTQIGRLQAGATDFGAPPDAGYLVCKARFAVIAELNDLLGDARSTSALFAGIEQRDPAAARRYASRAMPALVATGAWTLADRYRSDPLHGLADLNALVHAFPLFPPPGTAPRLGATLSGMVREVHLVAAILTGLGDAQAAAALRTAFVDGIDDLPLRALAQRELAEPGTITRDIVAYRMAQDASAPS